MIRFVRAVEHLSQNLYRYGLTQPSAVLMPILRLPVPENPSPEAIDYPKFRAVLLDFRNDLVAAEAALAEVKSGEAKIPVDLLSVRYDANGDGRVDPDERFAAVIAAVTRDNPPPAGAQAVIAFDRADAIWLRGYSNVLMALCEFLLAHDWQESFDTTFHLFFPNTGSPFVAALAPADPDLLFGDAGAIADVVSFVHIPWPVTEPVRMGAVRDHLKRVVALSRENWAAIEAETDDDREWLPSPRQHASFGMPAISAEQIAAWHGVLDEADALLDGRKLVPHWRFAKGIDLKRVFEAPRPFDLVLWITGPAALPYLADGEVLSGAEWNRLIAAFEGNFGSYAIWFN